MASMPSGAAVVRQLIDASTMAMLQGQMPQAEAVLAQAKERLAEELAEAADDKKTQDLLLESSAELVATKLKLAMLMDDQSAAEAAVAELKSAQHMKFLTSPRIAAALAQHALFKLIAADPTAQTMSLQEARDAVASSPSDASAQLRLCRVAAAQGDMEQCVEAALATVKIDRGDHRDAAKTLLLTLFDALGPQQPMVVAARKQLSQLLFA